mmetsp:Transcript_37709/g.84000  ORF Transcript_37709/g.84000 Transcript_37709/m.84000 type:complete len:212 (-) Transcript_37709:1012-1647(-)
MACDCPLYNVPHEGVAEGSSGGHGAGEVQQLLRLVLRRVLERLTQQGFHERLRCPVLHPRIRPGRRNHICLGQAPLLTSCCRIRTPSTAATAAAKAAQERCSSIMVESQLVVWDRGVGSQQGDEVVGVEGGEDAVGAVNDGVEEGDVVEGAVPLILLADCNKRPGQPGQFAAVHALHHILPLKGRCTTATTLPVLGPCCIAAIRSATAAAI